MIEGWRERLEEGIRRQPLPERTALLERLIVAHESHEEIMASWADEVRRRLAEYEAGKTEWVPTEEVLAKLRAATAKARENWKPPPVPANIDDIEDQAFHLTHDDFYALLVNVEAELPPEIDARWRERRYREQEAAGGSLPFPI